MKNLHLQVLKASENIIWVLVLVRYDLSFFVIFVLILDLNNPANERAKMVSDYNFGHSVLNFGINYPF
jgi:hypothetical protein